MRPELPENAQPAPAFRRRYRELQGGDGLYDEHGEARYHGIRIRRRPCRWTRRTDRDTAAAGRHPVQPGAGAERPARATAGRPDGARPILRTDSAKPTYHDADGLTLYHIIPHPHGHQAIHRPAEASTRHGSVIQVTVRYKYVQPGRQRSNRRINYVYEAW